VSFLKVSWQRMALRRFQRSSERLQASISLRISRGKRRRSVPRRWEAMASTRSHHAPVTIISSYIGRAAMSWNRSNRRNSVSSIAQ
jgi:hypothetical protein